MDSLSSINNASDLHHILNKEADIMEGIDTQGVYDRMASRHKTDALGNFAKFLLTGGGIGLGARGIYGMLRLLGRHDEEEEDPEEPNVVYGRVPVAKAAGASTLPIGPKLVDFEGGRQGYLLESQEDVDAYLQPMMQADISQFLQENPDASFGYFLASPAGQEYVGSLTESELTEELAKESVDTRAGSRALWSGLKSPLKMLGGGLGLTGGWKLMDYLMDKRRKSEADEELESAKEEYEEAIIAASRGKAASDQVLGQELDKLFDTCMHKSAEVSKQAGLPEFLGGVGGAYAGAYAVPSMALAAILSYPFFSKRQRKKLLEKARQKREREKIERTPLPIHLEPGSLSSLEEEEEEENLENSAVALNISPALDFEDSLDRV